MPHKETLENSPIIKEVEKHFAAIEEAKELDVGMSLTLPRHEYNVSSLIEFAEDACKSGKPKLVVVPHDFMNKIEIARVNDGISTKLAYNLCGQINPASAKEGLEDAIGKAVEVLREYLNKPEAELKAYDGQMGAYKKDEVVSYTYLHRKLSRNRYFKNHPEGATKYLQDVITKMVETHGLMIEIAKEVTIKKYGMSARMFKIVVPNVMANDSNYE